MYLGKDEEYNMCMYEVVAKCGHVGKNYFVEKSFAVKAETRKEAAAIARQIPRVKHHHTDAIRSVREINLERFNEIIKVNSEDPYFFCHNIQEQRDACVLDLHEERHYERELKKYEYLDYKPVYYGKKRIKNPKKFFTRYIQGGIA